MTNWHELPNGWKRVSLEEVAFVQTGIAKGKKNIATPLRRPYLRVANVQEGYVDTSEVKDILVTSGDAVRYALRKGDVLLTEGGDFDKLGRGCVWEEQVPDCLHQNHVFAVRTQPGALNPYFLSYQTWSEYGKRYFINCSKQSTNLASINSTQVKQFPVLLPPPEEQSAIVDAIRVWDRATSLTERLIAANQKLRKGLMQQLLTGKRRFPGLSGRWQEHRLGEVTTESKDRNGGRFGRDAVRAVTNSAGMIPMREQTIAENLERYKIVEPSGFAYNPMRINVGSLCMWQGKGSALVSPDYVVFSCNPDGLDPNYFDYLRETHRWNHYMQAAGNGSVRVRIYYDDLAVLRFILPPIAEQRRISGFFKILDRELSLLQAQLDVLKTQKNGLMQKLLTGEVRVKIAEDAA